ncbi:Fc.00g033460.m01.CDS01 [Cosmosporella sp. VM-42]
MTRVGSFPNPSRVEYKFLPGVESLEKYRPGGYHPVHIGDVLHDRYEVIHKLGYGGYSTTWLCRDKHSNSYVAVKVGTAYSNPREAEIVAFLHNEASPLLGHPGRRMIPSVQDRFILPGPNGNHPCYTTTPALCSLTEAKAWSNGGLFQVETARSLAAQLLLAVDYIHARGVVHGDIHLCNMLIRLSPDFDQLSIPQLYKKYGAPIPLPVVRLDGRPLHPSAPLHGVPQALLGHVSNGFTPSEVEFLLKDFGESYNPFAELRDYSNTHLSLVPPEAQFEEVSGLSFPADIWSVGCAIWAILGQRPLFNDVSSNPDDITADQTDVLGDLPRDWWEKWDARGQYFAETGKPAKGRIVTSWMERFESHIELPRRKGGVMGFSAEERTAIMDMLRSMLVFRPEKRQSAKEILQFDWMVKWALPEFEQSRWKKK